MTGREQLLQAREGWRPPRELACGCPRDVRLTANGVAVFLVAVFLAVASVAAGISLYFVAADKENREHLLAANPVETQARLIRLWRRGGDKPRCLAEYAFDTSGHSHSRIVTLRCRDWQSLETGSLVPVRFVSSNPEISRLTGLERPAAKLYWLAPLAVVLLAGSAAGLHFLLRSQRILLEEGRPVAAVVTHFRKVHHGHAQGNEVHFEFLTIGGTRVQGEFGPVTSKSTPTPGSTLTVLYHPDDPHRNARYPLSLYRTAR